MNYGKVIITSADGKELEISTVSLPLEVVYVYKEKEKKYIIKETKNNKLIMN